MGEDEAFAKRWGARRLLLAGILGEGLAKLVY
jgi:hypothetical protein